MFVFAGSAGFGTPPDENPEYQFSQGLKAFSDGDLAMAKSHYVKAYALEPANPNIAYNLGIVFLAQEKVGPSIAMLRRAIYLSPTFGSARKALDKAFEKTNTQTAAEALTNFEILRSYLLGRIPSAIFLFITALLFLFAGWNFIGWLGQRKRAKIDELDPPMISTTTILLVTALILSTVLSGFKLFDLTRTRAVVINSNVDLRSGPSSDHPRIAEIFEGFDVIIKREKDGWAQIEHPGGYSGWLQTSQIFNYSTNDSRFEFVEEKQ